ncbi:MAG: hypothetical protein NWQ45_06245, partial [Congregibacter sp.]|nr:hypothetical protein [Congregibacter sp.]
DLFGSIALINLELNGVTLPIAGEMENQQISIKVEGGSNKLDIEFNLDRILAVQTASFQHILEGFDTDWQDTGNINVVTYQNLPPG